MKSKFIMVMTAILLIITLLFFAVPTAAMSSDVDIGIASESTAAETAYLAVLDSEATLTFDSNAVPVPAASAGNISIWLALGATLTIIMLACRRRLPKMINQLSVCLRLSNDASEGAKLGGGLRNGILPVAA